MIWSVTNLTFRVFIIKRAPLGSFLISIFRYVWSHIYVLFSLVEMNFDIPFDGLESGPFFTIFIRISLLFLSISNLIQIHRGFDPKRAPIGSNSSVRVDQISRLCSHADLISW